MRLTRLAPILFLLLGPAPSTAYDPASATADLHAHMFMKEGLRWFFRGHFRDPLEANSWDDRLSNQITAQTLEASNIGLMVVSLYASPAFVWDIKKSIRDQIRLTHEFVRDHPDWVIARDPYQARREFLRGKRLLIFSLEGASGVIDSDADIQEFVIEKGIRIITLLHLWDDHYGGASFLPGFRAFSNVTGIIGQIFNPTRSNGVRINQNGLTKLGIEITKKLISHHVWVDLTHASDRSAKELIRLSAERNLPLLYSHTSVRKFLRAERAVPDWELEKLAKLGGIVGLVPSPNFISEFDVPAPECTSDLTRFVQHFNHVTKILGSNSVMVGSDHNGAIPHLRPSPSCPTGTSLDKEGLWNIAQHPDLWTAMDKKGALVAKPRSGQIIRFLDQWQRLFPKKDSANRL